MTHMRFVQTLLDIQRLLKWNLSRNATIRGHRLSRNISPYKGLGNVTSHRRPRQQQSIGNRHRWLLKITRWWMKWISHDKSVRAKHRRLAHTRSWDKMWYGWSHWWDLHAKQLCSMGRSGGQSSIWMSPSKITCSETTQGINISRRLEPMTRPRWGKHGKLRSGRKCPKLILN